MTHLTLGFFIEFKNLKNFNLKLLNLSDQAFA